MQRYWHAIILLVIMEFTLEVIAFSIASVVNAGKAGAHRIELCDNPAEGGTTASYGMIKTARENTDLELYPIIRPRGGDFLYSQEEISIMKRDIQLCKELGCDGVVIGALLPDGSINKDATSLFADIAYPLGVTFHRAFDRVANPFEALEQVIQAGCERILTSGLKPTAPEGADMLADLVRQANERIIIMPGSGIRSGNIAELAKATGAKQFHSSARYNAASQMQYINPQMEEQLESTQLNVEEVQQLLANLQSYAATFTSTNDL